jgi:hypothetical protein
MEMYFLLGAGLLAGMAMVAILSALVIAKKTDELVLQRDD